MYKQTIDFSPGGVKENLHYIFSLYGVPSNIIEIGVFEGGTTCWLSDELTPYNPNLTIYAIDPHSGVGSENMLEDPNDTREIFKHNLSVNKHKNIQYIQKTSEDGLIDLINQGVKPELIYIDGDHKASEVLLDLTLSFKMLAVGGVILCDDAIDWQHKDSNGMISSQMSPRMAIEMFLACNWHKVKPLPLPKSYQTAFIKIC